MPQKSKLSFSMATQSYLQSFMIRQLISPLKESEFEDSLSLVANPDYLQNIKLQCIISNNALKTAEALISAYKKENEALKAEISSLWQFVRNQDDTFSIQNDLKLIKSNESVCKCATQIDGLLQLIEEKDERILALENKLTQVEQRERAYLQRKKGKIQIKFKEFSSKYAPTKPNLIRSDKSSIQVLQAQLNQKKAEVMMLLRHLRDVDQKIKSKKERLKTPDTVENSSYHKQSYSYMEE